MAGLNVVKNVLDCLKPKYVVTDRVFWSNVKSYSGTCRPTSNESWKLSLLQLSMTVGKESFVWLCPLVTRPTQGSRGAADGTRLPRVGHEVVSVIALENNGFFLPLLSSRVCTGAPYLRTQNLCSLQLFYHTSSLSLSIFSSILLERPSIWTMSYSVCLLLTTLLQFSMKTQQRTVASGFDLTHAIS